MGSLSQRNRGDQATPVHIQGLNLLRFLAAMLVFAQHSLSSSHLDQWIDIGGWRIGRVGTALFFLLSGFLSAKTTRKPLTWLHDRILFLFPPFWIVTLVGFFLAAVTATKTFDGWQVASQLCGLGYFTHGDHMVNVATWFMSPLILLYLAVTVARLISPGVISFFLITGLIVAAMVHAPGDATVYCHSATFFGAFAMALVPEDFRSVSTFAMADVLCLLACFQSEFRYGALASVLLLLAFQVHRKVPLCNHFSGIAYEWFLVHGLCLATVCHLTTSPLTITLIGAGLSVVAAIALQRLVRWTKSFFHPNTASSTDLPIRSQENSAASLLPVESALSAAESSDGSVRSADWFPASAAACRELPLFHGQNTPGVTAADSYKVCHPS